jgi:polysaccharide deacetylase family protein (PEP-CTERM system associated)
MLNAATVDVEEYFHPTEVQAAVDQSRWPSLPSRVEDQLKQVLELLDKRRTKATFFVLGWVAERNPRAIERIVAAGHEVGCHSHLHQLVYSLSPQEFRRDTRRAVSAIQNACGVTPALPRSQLFDYEGIDVGLEILVEEGFVSDSSIYPIAHDRYGIRVRPGMHT